MTTLLLLGALLVATLGAAWGLARVVERLGAPPLVGMIAGGALIGAMPLRDVGLDAVSSPIRLAVLVLVLLRAGLGLSVEDLRRAGPLALRLGTLPLLGDTLLVAVAGHLLLGLPPLTALALGFLVGAISPAIAIPGLMEILADAPPDRRRTPAALLTGAPLDNIVAVVALGVVLDMVVEGQAAWGAVALTLPWALGGGVALGLLAGLALAGLAPATGRGTDLALWALGGAIVWLGQQAGPSFVLALLTLGATVRARRPDLARELAGSLARHWRWAKIALFALIGAAVDLPALAGVGVAAVLVITLGQAGRAAATWAATVGAGLSPRDRLACVAAYVPKATIQAAFASLAIDRGVPGGEVLLGTAVLAVVLTAPLGVITLFHGARALLDIPPRTAGEPAAAGRDAPGPRTGP